MPLDEYSVRRGFADNVSGNYSLMLVAGTPGAEGERTGPAHVLLVEDTAIIALDIEDMLMRDKNVSVVTAGTVAEATRALETVPFEFGILDINLGSEDSLPIARQLAKAGIPFVFMSGYGSDADLGGQFEDVPVLDKPLRPELLLKALHTAIPRLKG